MKKKNGNNNVMKMIIMVIMKWRDNEEWNDNVIMKW